jgi:oligopeptide transport system permease protein
MTAAVTTKPRKSNSLWSDAWKRLKKNRGAVLSAWFVAIVCLISFLAPWVAPYSFEAQDMSRVLVPPDMHNLLGTDSLGRDLLSRLIYGARVSMMVGMITTLLSLLIGTVYGAFAGWFGGKTDAFLMRFVDLIQSIPDIVLLVLVMVYFDATLPEMDPELRALVRIIVALSITGWVGVARVVRGQVLQTKQLQFIEAATALGASRSAIVWRHILPNIMGPIIVTLTFQIPANILYESFLSFIGLGLQPPFASWGVLASEGWRSLKTYPHLMLFPGIALGVSMLAFNLFGDGLRDALDPKMKNR